MHARTYTWISILIFFLGFAIFVITPYTTDSVDCEEQQNALMQGVIILTAFYVASMVFIGIAYGKGLVSLNRLLAVVLMTLPFLLTICFASLYHVC